MKLLLASFFVLVSIVCVSAQTMSLSNGHTVSAEGLERNGQMVTVAVKTSTGAVGHVGYQVSDIVQLQLPEPKEIASATDLISKGKYDQALAVIEPVVAYQKTIQDIPGNWWARAALVQATALNSSQRASDSRPLLEEILAKSKDPATLSIARLQLALIAPPKDPMEGIAAFDSIINSSTDQQALSQAWIAKGDIYFGQHQFDEAALAYLNVPVFYPTHNPLMAKALWGLGQSYSKLKDAANAVITLNQLISSFPDSPEAGLAKVELLKLDTKT